MRALKIAIALIRVPRLFVTLILLPLLLSLVFIWCQLVATGVLLRASTRNAEEYAASMEHLNQKSFRRYLVHGTMDPLPPLIICRWQEKSLPNGSAAEEPPAGDCALRKLDVTIRTPSPESFDAEPYRRMLDGNVRRLHLCRSCQSGTLITRRGERVRTVVDSVWGLWVLQLAKFNTHVQRRYVEAAVELEGFHDQFGKLYLNAAGFRDQISMSGIQAMLAVLANVALIIIVSLVLALKAHRKVLDYFARNGALLPMVAAAGNGPFYGAIWILTFFRVAAFLLAAVPLTLEGFETMLSKAEFQTLFGREAGAFTLWTFTLWLSLGLATLVASIADLKHRHSWLSFGYKYLPLLVSLLGALLWAGTFILGSGTAAGVLRSVFTALPVAGLAPLLVAPICKPSLNVLALHAVLSVGLLVLILKHNARWFAAHLEEL